MIRLENLTKHFEVPGKAPVIAANNISMEVGQVRFASFWGRRVAGKPRP